MEAGERLGHFEIVAPLGAGGMGAVYRAHDTKLGRDVALKVLPDGLVRDATALSRFRREATLLAALNHPNIATIHSVEESDGGPFLVLELVEGVSLAQRLAAGPPSVSEALVIARQVAVALAAAHEAGIMHRDLKPANVMVGPAAGPAVADPVVKVLDFGLAKSTRQEPSSAPLAPGTTAPGVLIGTPLYMSPEQIRGEVADARSDVWAFGCLLYETLSGKPAFGGVSFADTRDAILEREPRMDALPDATPSAVRRLLAACLRKSADERKLSMADVRGRLAAASARPAPGSAGGRSRAAWVTFGAAAVVALVVILAVTQVKRRNAELWARNVALPEIDDLIAGGHYSAAVGLAEEVERVLEDDPALAERWPRMSRAATLATVPSNTVIELTPIPSPRWAGGPVVDTNLEVRSGGSPYTEARLPFGPYRIRVTAPGFAPFESVFVNEASESTKPLEATVELHPEGALPARMVPVQRDNLTAFVLGVGEIDPTPDGPDDLPYLIGRHEVTNREFKEEFVDAGGYSRPELWQHEFVDGDRVLSPEQALDRFRDRSGRPGPATWDGGTYPPGQGDHPVTGVSWYEAAAYAALVGAELPTLYHWHGARDRRLSLELAVSSNFGPGGMLPVGSTPFGAFGACDMAGNAREWAWNRCGRSRYILGGGWNDPFYTLNQGDLLPPLDRSPTNGIRLAEYLGASRERLAPLLADIERPGDPFEWGSRISDDVYRAYRERYAYDRGPLRAAVDGVDDDSPFWRKEHVSFDAAYDGERVSAYVFLPRHVDPPYQAIVYFPGVGVMRPGSSRVLQNMATLGPLIKSGRAVIYPIYKDTYERYSGLASNARSPTRAYADHKIRWMNDVGRSVDYLEERGDVDMDRIAYMGLSWGAEMAPIALATEPRLSVAVLHDGGAVLRPVLPEADESIFAPRVRAPVLMINGSHDYVFPVETTQKPFFDLLGTPDADKRHVTLPGGHVIFNTHPDEVLRETLAWLDRHLGRVH